MRTSKRLASISRVTVAALRLPGPWRMKSPDLPQPSFLARQDVASMQIKHRAAVADVARKEESAS
jgi:hypothetical protein